MAMTVKEMQAKQNELINEIFSCDNRKLVRNGIDYLSRNIIRIPYGTGPMYEIW